MKIIILTESDIRSCVSMDTDAMSEVKLGFSKLAAGEVTLPPIMRIDVLENHGEVDVKSAYIHGLDSFAIKIAAGFFDNRLLGLPTGSGMMVLVSAKTGRPEAVLLDNGYLTDVRTGIAGAIAADYLAKENIHTTGVIGSGMQARYQMRALKLVRNFSRLMVYGIVSEEVDRYIKDMERELGVEVVKAGSAETLVRESEVVVTSTPAHEPYLRAEWLHPGLHITCMGSDAEDKQELFADVFEQGDRIVCDSKAQCFRLGELHHAREAGVITKEDEIIELGEIILGVKNGRQSEDEITICDLTGVGVQDTQIARLTYQRAVERDLGLSLEV
jgi:ectoine utilization protein EutC